MTVHPLIAALTADVRKADVTPNTWNGVDVDRGTGTIRFYSEGTDPREGITVVSLTGSGVVQWQARFDATTPKFALDAFVREALA